MKRIDWQWLKGLPRLLATPSVDPARQAERIAAMQLHIVLPARIGVVGVMLYYLYDSGWFQESQTIHFIVAENLVAYFFVYILCNLIAALLFSFWKGFPTRYFTWLAAALGLLDGLFIAGLTFLTEGF